MGRGCNPLPKEGEKMKGNYFIFIALICFVGSGNAISFRKVAEIPSGADDRAFGFDTDQDGKQNLVFGSPTGGDINFGMHYWEHIGFDQYFLEDSALWSVLFDVGFLDADSLVDMVGNRNAIDPWPLYVYESPTQNSNPTNIVWQEGGFMNICGSYITDLDQDGLKEILFGYTDSSTFIWHTCVYENTGDNQYSRVWEDTLNHSASFIDGDFDLDGRIEFITGCPLSVGGLVLAWECVGDNDYQLIFQDTLPWSNNYDVFEANDMDDNGKPEFLFTSVHYAIGIVWLYVYETIGDNNYDFFLIDSITGLPSGIIYQLSTCGDFDADGIEEIIWSTFNQWHIYKATDIHQYQKIYSSAWTSHDITVMSVYDLNENGYPEIIESWEENTIPYTHGTVIWEIEGVRLHQPNGGETLQVGSQYSITWEKFDPPGADSFQLFVSFDNGVDYQPITTIPQSNDTMYLWTIPDSLSDSCKIMIWAYGPPRSGEQEPRGVAWDFSDSVFAITEPGIKESESRTITDFSLKVFQNPMLSGKVMIQYSLPKASAVKLIMYNSLGQVQQVLVNAVTNAGVHEINLNNDLPSSVYFIQLQTPEQIITRKIVKIE